MPHIDCPICERVDLVQKVTALVEGETHHTLGIHSNTAQSAIARRLMPPIEPTPPDEPDFGSSASGKSVAGCLGMISAVASWLLIIQLMSSLMMRPVASDDAMLVMAFCGFFISFPLAGLVGYGVVSIINSIFASSQYPAGVRKKMLGEYEAKLSSYQLNRNRWKKAIQRWNSMFYCRRCDVVYVPGDGGKSVSPDYITDLAYQDS